MEAVDITEISVQVVHTSTEVYEMPLEAFTVVPEVLETPST